MMENTKNLDYVIAGTIMISSRFSYLYGLDGVFRKLIRETRKIILNTTVERNHFCFMIYPSVMKTRRIMDCFITSVLPFYGFLTKLSHEWRWLIRSGKFLTEGRNTISKTLTAVFTRLPVFYRRPKYDPSDQIATNGVPKS